MVAETEARPIAYASAIWSARALVGRMAELGVDNACVCAGSRSSPLTMALVEHPGVRVWSHVDERSAAYFALGMAKADRAPVALVCTSGTACANFLPAIVEAHHSGVPLIVMTADRPHELRGTGALQAIDQLKLYGDYVNWFVDAVPPPEPAGSQRYMRSIATQAVRRSLLPPRGPVQLNLPFREPVVPEEPAPPIVPVGCHEQNVETQSRLDVASIRHFARLIQSSARGLVVCGPQDDPNFPEAVVGLAAAAGFPILADPGSQLRAGSHDQSLIVDNYDLFLRNQSVSTGLQPDLVLRFGMTSTSKALLGYLAGHEDACQVSIHPPGGLNDPSRTVDHIVDVDPARFAADVQAALDGHIGSRSGWLQSWQAVAGRCRLLVQAELAASASLSEPRVLEGLRDLLPSDGLLYVGNSMPVRDLDAFFSKRKAPLRVFGNRGVNGIDGLVSSALGVAAAQGERVFLVIGDLSFYHDMNGLLAAKLHAIDATIVLLNNDGGGIFHFLPQADRPDTFEPYFVMPTGLDFGPSVRMYGGRVARPVTWGEFVAAMRESCAHSGLTVIEVKTDRRENAALHRRIWAAVSEDPTFPAATG